MPADAIPAAWAARVWRVLVEECGGQDDQREFESFRRYVGEPLWCGHEWRFQGALGFGGKLYNSSGQWRVACYREDLTPKRASMIERANFRLAALRAERDGERGATDE